MKKLYIDDEAVASLAMLQEGLLYPVTRLMNENEANNVDKIKKYHGVTFPFSFILAPSGKRNEQILQNTTKGEKLIFINNNKEIGYIIVNEVFPIDKEARIKQMYATLNPEHPGVKSLYKRLGNYAVSGDFKIDFNDIKDHINQINKAIKKVDAKKISAIMLSAKPFHRVHERLIRTSLVKNDLIVIFILKPYHQDELNFDIRYKSLKYFCDNYLPKDKVIIIPLENTYIFGGFNEMLLNAIVAKNYGCNELIIGKNQAGLGAFYDHNEFNTILDTLKGIDIHIEIMSEFVYCNQCKTLVSTNACPHGIHHHVKYHNDSIMQLLKMGIMPPAILMRKDISAIILSEMFPEKCEILCKIRRYLLPNNGIIDEFKLENFYLDLMELYQTSSLT